MDKRKQPTERLLTLMVKGKAGGESEKVVGAVTRTDNQWVFYKQIIPKRDILRLKGVWGIDVRILKALREEGVKVIHCVDVTDNILYVADLDDFEAHGETIRLATTQTYLPFELWQHRGVGYRTCYIKERQLLD
jgi:hypothetical protein